ncbi:MAG: hypothetical protein ABL958_04750, partial [Bdellovibrionia bacterium]
LLSKILQTAAQYSDKVWLETHGQWILSENAFLYQELIETIANHRTIVKISFDRMHGLSADKLRSITQFLDMQNIDWVVAITEATEVDFLATRGQAYWIEDSRVIFQKKAAFGVDLIKPRVGVIGVDANLKIELSQRNTFSRESESFGIRDRRAAQ